MRFPVFSSGQWNFPQDQWYGFYPGTGCRGSCPSRIPPRPPFYPAGSSAAFIPARMRGPRCGGQPCQHHASGPSSQQMPCFSPSDCMSQPVFDAAVSATQDLLNELFGQPSCCSADRKKDRQKTSQQPSSRCAQAKRSNSAASASRFTPSDKVQTSSTDSEHKPTKPVQKTEDQMAAEKSMNDHLHERKSRGSVWSHSLYFPGFTPDNISVKVKNSKVYVNSVQKQTHGPSTCLGKLEVTKVVMLPENVDHTTLTCSMDQNNTLVLQAHFTDNMTTKSNAEEKKMMTDRAEDADVSKGDMPEADFLETKSLSEKAEASADQEDKARVGSQQDRMMTATEHKSNGEQTLEDRDEHLKALENKAGTMPALEDKLKMGFLENKYEDLQASESTVEEAKIETDTPEPLQSKKEDALEKPDGKEYQHQAEKEDISYTGEVEEDLTAEKLDRPCYHHSDDAQEPHVEEMRNDLIPSDVEDDVNNQTTNQNDTTSFPIIEEPEEQTFSDDEQLLPKNTISHQSSTEDFVVVDEDSINSQKTDIINADTKADEEVVSTDLKEDSAEEKMDREINSTDETDPTRPIKRTNNQDAQESQETSSTPEQSGTFCDGLAAVPPHSGPFCASLPLVGFHPDDVQVKLQGHTLRIAAKRWVSLGDAAYMENVERRLELPEYVDVLTVRCVYQQDKGCLVITAEPHDQQRQVPVELQ